MVRHTREKLLGFSNTCATVASALRPASKGCLKAVA